MTDLSFISIYGKTGVGKNKVIMSSDHGSNPSGGIV